MLLVFAAIFITIISGYKWAGFINGENAPYLTYQVDPGQADLTFISIHHDGGIKRKESRYDSI